MEAKQFLEQYKDALTNIKNLEDQKAELETVATSAAIVTDRERVQSSRRQDRMADTAVKIASIEDYIIEWRLWALHVLQEIESVIRQVDNPDMRKVLHMRYIERKTWGKIAEETKLSYRWVLRTADKALSEVERILAA